MAAQICRSSRYVGLLIVNGYLVVPKHPWLAQYFFILLWGNTKTAILLPGLWYNWSGPGPVEIVMMHNDLSPCSDWDWDRWINHAIVAQLRPLIYCFISGTGVLYTKHLSKLLAYKIQQLQLSAFCHKREHESHITYLLQVHAWVYAEKTLCTAHIALTMVSWSFHPF